jgi:hypothetical protein
MRILDVSLGDPGGPDFNTVVLTGVDLVIPLEADLDGDPLHDDEVRLVSEAGDFDAVLTANDEDVQHLPDKNLYAYKFRDVPPGVYRVLVRIAEQGWATVLGNLVVHRGGARLEGQEITSSEPEAVPLEETTAGDGPQPPAQSLGMKLGDYVDVADNFFEDG